MSDNDEFAEFVNDYGDVVLCDCGGVNITTGAVTLHIEPEDVQALHELAAAAVEMVAGTAQPQPKSDPKSGKSPRTVH